jgi:hypothetical protein
MRSIRRLVRVCVCAWCINDAWLDCAVALIVIKDVTKQR